MWIPFAFLSAFFAALVAIFAKLGLKGIDSTLATSVRAVIMAVFLLVVAVGMHKFDSNALSSISRRDWILIALSGVAGALSWLFYFYAIKAGVTTSVVAIDKLSIVLVVILAALFLGEKVGWLGFLGALLMAVGAYLITIK
ncbi:MAG: EamA family transporter [bacterium]